MMARAIIGLLLAAGSSSRFGGDKLRYRLPGGVPIAVAAANSLRPACDRLVAVVRPDASELAVLLTNAGCEIIHCPEAHLGIGHSLAAGVRATPRAAGWLVALADMPFIASDSHLAVAACLRQGASMAATQYQGKRGHPVGFSRAWLHQLAALTGDHGARALLEKHRQMLVLCPVDDRGVLSDIDSQQDLERLYPQPTPA